MTTRRFRHASNPGFPCSEAVVIVPFGRESYVPAIVEVTGGSRVELGETTDRIVYDLDQVPVATTLVYSGMGGPAVANALEMVAANGGRRVVVFGACGGVDAQVSVGDIVVATAGVRGEGTSSYYAPQPYPAVMDADLTDSLWRLAVARAGTQAHRGVVFTTDASYRQGGEIYKECSGLVVAVDCECAAAAVVGTKLGLTIGCLLFCTDNVALPEDADRVYRTLADSRVLKGFEEGLDIVLAALEASGRGGASM